MKCPICGNEIIKKNCVYRTCCSRSCARKYQWTKSEVRDKMIKSIRKSKTPEWKAHLSEALKRNPEVGIYNLTHFVGDKNDWTQFCKLRYSNRKHHYHFYSMQGRIRGYDFVTDFPYNSEGFLAFIIIKRKKLEFFEFCCHIN